MEKSEKEQALVYIDDIYKKKLDKIAEKYKDDSEHYINRLEAKYVYILAILLAIKNSRKPQKSKKKTWIIRTEYLKTEDRVILQSLLFSLKKDIKILLPDNSSYFYNLCEELANAGMDDVIEYLEDKRKIENDILLEAGKILPKE